MANSLADVARHKGRTDRALEWYARSKRVYESIGAWETNIVRLNLALMMMFEDRYDEAHDEVMACFEAFENGGHEITLRRSATPSRCRGWPIKRRGVPLMRRSTRRRRASSG